MASSSASFPKAVARQAAKTFDRRARPDKILGVEVELVEARPALVEGPLGANADAPDVRQIGRAQGCGDSGGKRGDVVEIPRADRWNGPAAAGAKRCGKQCELLQRCAPIGRWQV